MARIFLGECCLTGVTVLIDVRWMVFGARVKEWSRVVWFPPCSQKFVTCCVLLMMQEIFLYRHSPKLTQFQTYGIFKKSKIDII
jgi:hypothetical protein